MGFIKTVEKWDKDKDKKETVEIKNVRTAKITLRGERASWITNQQHVSFCFAFCLFF